jgi:hypothetical protein
MTFRIVRRAALGGLLAIIAGLWVGCGSETTKPPELPPSAPAPPPLTGADAAKANSPQGGSAAGRDPNPGAPR